MTILAVTDLETTGFKPDREQIVEFCSMLYDLETQEHRCTFTKRFRPSCSIKPGAFKTHGMSLEDVKDEPHFSFWVPMAQAIFRQADVLVCHNTAFDGEWLEHHANIKMPSYCTMQNGRFADHTGKIPKLGDLCFALDVAYDPAEAHAAEYDVAKTAECLFAGINAGEFKNLGEVT